MRRLKFCLSPIILVLCLFSPAAHAQEENDIWRQFVAQLKSGQFSADQIRPYDQMPKSIMFEFLSRMRQGATWSEWETSPETHRVGNRVHYLIPLID
jgi:hypothetical protein